jgi:hypothetical protein
MEFVFYVCLCEFKTSQYAARQTFPVVPSPGAKEILCEDDLYRHYNLHMYVHGDNSTCLRPPQPPFVAPGFGGAYDGKVRVMLLPSVTNVSPCALPSVTYVSPQPLFVAPDFGGAYDGEMRVLFLGGRITTLTL